MTEQGIKELSRKETVEPEPTSRMRKVGGGRKASVKEDKQLQVALEKQGFRFHITS